MYKNFIFDLYGTLVDIHTDEGKPAFWKFCAQILTDLGVPYDWKAFRAEYRALVAAEKAKPEFQIPEPEIDLYPVFQKLLRDKASDDNVRFLATVFRVRSREYVRKYSQIDDILKMLKENGRKVYLLSNAQSLFTMGEMEQLGLIPYFDDIFISSDLGVKKPSPDFMNALIKKHNLKIEESIMVGNDVACDVGVAKAVGMDSLYVFSNLSPTTDVDTPTGATYENLIDGELTLKDFEKLL